MSESKEQNGVIAAEHEESNGVAAAHTNQVITDNLSSFTLYFFNRLNFAYCYYYLRER